jgi:hypothetical protein
MAKKKYIETSEILWQHFLNYKNFAKNNPITVTDWVGKDALLVERKKEKPLTIEGFENYLEDNEIIGGLGDYFTNKNNAYSQYSTICSRIKRNVRQDQIEGGMTGIYNSSITQRLNNLEDKKVIEQNINTSILKNDPFTDASDNSTS